MFMKGQIPWNKGKENPKMQGRGHPNYGKHPTEETRNKMSQSQIGNKKAKGHRCSEDVKKHWSLIRQGRKWSDEAKNKLKGRPAWNKGKKGFVPWNKEKSWTDDLKKKLSESHRGKVPWNKGKKGYHFSEETRKRLIGKGKGRKFSSEHRRKKAEAQLGNKGSNWRGGISFEPYCPKFNRQLKMRVRERDNFTCQLCGVIENGKNLSIHHIHYDKNNCYPDLIALCVCCNTKVNSNRKYYEELFMNMLNSRDLLLWRLNYV